MTGPEWLSLEDVLQIHRDQIERYGGAFGVRNSAALEGCLARPKNLMFYESPDIFDLAACYSYGLVKNHCFVDGNKRTGFVSGVVFLLENGFLLPPTASDAAQLFEGVAAGLRSEIEIADFFRNFSLPLPPD